MRIGTIKSINGRISIFLILSMASGLVISIEPGESLPL